MCVMTQPELIALGASKMEAQFLAWGLMSYFIKKKAFKIKYDFFSELDPLDYVKIQTALC